MPNANDIIIVGAGIAGCAVASAFAKQGKRVLLIERSLNEPKRIVGELLQPGGVAALEKLGLGDCLEGIDAQPVKGYHIYWKDQETTFWFCPTHSTSQSDVGRAEFKAPEGRSFHHGRFVMNLRQATRQAQNITILEGTVVEILRCPETGTVVGVRCARDKELPTDVSLRSSHLWG